LKYLCRVCKFETESAEKMLLHKTKYPSHDFVIYSEGVVRRWGTYSFALPVPAALAKELEFRVGEKVAVYIYKSRLIVEKIDVFENWKNASPRQVLANRP